MIEKMKRDSLKYLSESRKYVYYSALAFAFFVVMGFIFSSQLGFIDEFLKKIIDEVSQLEGTDITLYIFANNVQSAILGIIFGVFFGIIPAINIIVNGVVIGYVLSRATEVAGFFEIWKLFPHGIFELPAIFIALGLGIKLGMSFFSKEPVKTLKERFYLSAVVFLTVILPLLAIAAVIEGLLIALAD